MEVRPGPGIAESREQQYSPGLQPPSIHLSFTQDGAPIYKPSTVSPSIFHSAGEAAGDTLDSAGAIAAYRLNANVGDQIKRKRGRPRKYGPEGAIRDVGALSPAIAGSSGNPDSSPSSGLAIVQKKARGRPPGSGKKQQLAALGSAGVGFTPHIISVKAGEDVSSKIMSFSQNGPRAVCVLSANGAISNVTLRQAATSGGTVTYEGRFEILSLSGSFLLSESGGQRGRTGGLSVSLAGPDGRLLGGGVAGVLIAASPVQVIVGSFIVDRRRETAQVKASEPSSPAAPSGSAAVDQVHAAAEHGGGREGLPVLHWP